LASTRKNSRNIPDKYGQFLQLHEAQHDILQAPTAKRSHGPALSTQLLVAPPYPSVAICPPPLPSPLPENEEDISFSFLLNSKSLSFHASPSYQAANQA